MEKLPGELMIFGFLSPTLVTTYDMILYDTPFKEQFRLIEGLSSCQDVRKQWRSIADENPALFSREYCITAASKELMSRGPHIKRLVVLLPPDKTNASDDPSASDNFPSAGSAISAETKSIKPILEGLAVRPQLTYIHWDCRHPFTPPLRSDYPRLQNLTRLDLYFTLDTIRLFVGIVKYSPTLEYITIIGCITKSGSALTGTFTLPASVTTTGIYFQGLHLDAWIKDSWIIHHPITLVAMAPGATFRFLATKAARIDLRPSLRTSEEESAQALGPTEFEHHLIRLPREGERGTLAYSVIFFVPPSNIRPEEQEWVKVIALRTSDCSRMTEGERWSALLPHLDLIPRSFPSLQTIYLHYDFHNWRERPELHAFEASVSGRGMSLEYVLEQYIIAAQGASPDSQVQTSMVAVKKNIRMFSPLHPQALARAYQT